MLLIFIFNFQYAFDIFINFTYFKYLSLKDSQLYENNIIQLKMLADNEKMRETNDFNIKR